MNARYLAAGPADVIVGADEVKKGPGTVAIVLAILAGIFVFSPGGRYLFKHGRLPPER